jgi:hypothetical protein
LLEIAYWSVLADEDVRGVISCKIIGRNRWGDLILHACGEIYEPYGVLTVDNKLLIAGVEEVSVVDGIVDGYIVQWLKGGHVEDDQRVEIVIFDDHQL